MEKNELKNGELEHMVDSEENCNIRLQETDSTDVIEDEVLRNLPIPPDGGYGWVIVAVSFVLNGIVDGITASFAVYLPHLLEEYGEGKGKTSLVGSLELGMFLITGPFASVLVNCFGCRIVAMSGAILSTVIFCLATLSPNLDFLIAIYGGLGGIGVGLMYLPAMVMVGYYFEKKRALAMGIAYSGAGLGLTVMVTMVTRLLENFDWKSVLILESGLILQSCICGALMRPLKPPGGYIKRTKEEIEVEKEIIEINQLPDGTLMPSSVGDHMRLESRSTKSASSSPATKRHRTTSEGVPGRHSHGTKAMPWENVKIYDSPESQSCHELVNCSKGDLRKDILIKSAKTDSVVVKGTGASSEMSKNGHIPKISVSCYEFHKYPENRIIRRPISKEKLRQELSKPLARKDIFYSGSITNLPEYKTQPDMASYIASVTAISPEAKPKQKKCSIFSSDSFRTFKEMTGVNLLADPYFLVICVANFTLHIAHHMPTTFVTDFAMTIGLTPRDASTYLSVMGISNVFGRLTGGVVANIPRVNPLHVNNWSIITVGVVTILIGNVLRSHWTILAAFAVFGFAIGMFMPLCTLFLVDYLGLENLTNAYGMIAFARGIALVGGAPIAGIFVPLSVIFIVEYLGLHSLNNAFGSLSFVRGIAIICGPPLAGLILDVTGSYSTTFTIAGIIFIASGLVYYLLPVIKWYKNKKEGRAQYIQDDNIETYT